MSAIVTSSRQHHIADVNVSTNLEGFAVDRVYLFAIAGSGLSGAVTGSDFIAVESDTVAGLRESSFLDLFYNRIWIIEKHTDLGSIVANQTRTIELWNAHFVSKTFSGYAVAGDITVSGLASGTLEALQSTLYDVSVSLVGSPTLIASIVWTFTDAEALTFLATIVGQRIIPFTLRHNWTQSVLEQIAFKTDVLPALSGKEQRIGIRRLPRRRLEMSYMTLTPLERAYLENVLYGWQGRSFAVPVWSDVTPLVDAVGAGDNLLQANTVNRDFEVGGLVYLTNGTTQDVLEIKSLTPDSITTTTTTLHAYGIGTKVVPARLGILESKLDFSRITNQLETVRLAWQINADQDSTHRREAYTPVTYRGVELYNVSNDYSAEIAVTQNLVETLQDSGTGKFGKSVGEPFPRRTIVFTNLLTRDELGLFFEWINNRVGMLNPFWFVERVPSFFLQEDVISTDVTMIVTTGGYATHTFASPARRDIAILTTDGWKYRRITAATLNVDGITETITIDSALGVDLIAENNPLMSFLKLVRLASDTVELTYETSNVIHTATSFVDLLTN